MANFFLWCCGDLRTEQNFPVITVCWPPNIRRPIPEHMNNIIHTVILPALLFYNRSYSSTVGCIPLARETFDLGLGCCETLSEVTQFRKVKVYL